MADFVTRDLLFEIGTEEIPARFIPKAIEDLKEAAEKALQDNRMAYKHVRVFATPRRLALYVDGLLEFQKDQDRKVKGPSAKAAFDAEGRPTKAAVGFARSLGVEPPSLERVTDSNGEYVFAFVHDTGKRVNFVVPQILDTVMKALAFPKNMRWGSSDFKFVRPIRWLVLIWGDEAIHYEFEGVTAGSSSRGHRTLGPQGPVRLQNAEGYLDAMRSAGVIADQDEREKLIRAKVAGVASELGGTAVIDEELLQEVLYLVEYPTAFAGGFAAKFLELPEICITTPMQGHQRYFPVKKEDKLLNRFIAVRNGGTAGLDNVRHGNERVLSARLSDARFFFAEDMKKTLLERSAKLESIAFAEKLGSMKDKSERVTLLAAKIAAAGDAAGFPTDEEMGWLNISGKIMKSDLTTNMVREFTELQGEIGSIYARLEGLPGEVATAIVEHYMPKAAGGELPGSRIGSVLAIADKADSLAGYFGIGQVPTGSADPYALRRSALGLIAIHEVRRPAIGLLEILSKAVDGIWQGDAPRPKREILSGLEDFLTGRFRGQLLDEGHKYDLIDAAMALGLSDPSKVRVSLGALEKDAAEGWMEELGIAFVRVRNIAKNTSSATFDPKVLVEPAEERLMKEFQAAAADIASTLSARADVDGYAKAMNRFAKLKPAIDSFFTEVMVMCEDKYIRENRLGLVKAIETIALKLADFSKIAQ